MGMVSEDLGVTKLVDLSVMVPEHLSLHFYDFLVICYAFLKFTAILRKTCTYPLHEKEKLQPGPSPAFSTAAPCRWCSARHGLPVLRLGGTLGRGVRELPTNDGVWVWGGRNRARRCRWRQWRSGRQWCG